MRTLYCKVSKCSTEMHQTMEIRSYRLVKMILLAQKKKKTVKCMLHCSDFATRDHRNAEIVAIFFFIIKT